LHKPNLFIVYVNDVAASAAFYQDLFNLVPSLATPRFVAFPLEGGIDLALWSGAGAVRRDTARTSEVCLNIDGGFEAIDALYAEWSAKGVNVVEEPHDDLFGRTFVITDPDGNLIRVAPVD
jgi:predicted enzyme related to lactoylglutathione lyase